MAQFVEIDIDQGTDFSIDLGLKNDDGSPMDVTGYTFSSAIKKSFYSTSNVASFTVDVSGANTGSIILSLDANTTSDIKPGRYLFDIKQRNDTNLVERISEGVVTINPQVTE
jgi:hypothetical protein